ATVTGVQTCALPIYFPMACAVEIAALLKKRPKDVRDSLNRFLPPDDKHPLRSGHFKRVQAPHEVMTYFEEYPCEFTGLVHKIKRTDGRTFAGPWCWYRTPDAQDACHVEHGVTWADKTTVEDHDRQITLAHMALHVSF